MAQLKIATNNEIKIEKGVPMPEKHKRKAWPLEEMEIGDSFSLTSERMSALRSAIAYERRKTGKTFTVKTLPHEIRCWRTA